MSLSCPITAQKLCTDLVDPASIAPLLSCRLIVLDKNPGVRPVGIGDTARRIIAKAILSITKQDLQEAAGSMQLCAGQIAGIEAGVHTVHTLFQKEDTEAVLLVDASNAFNALNRQTALHNIRRLCPALATSLINTYRHLRNCTWMVMSYSPRKGQPRGIRLPCQCMPWPPTSHQETER